MKLLNVKDDAITIRKANGLIVVIKEEDNEYYVQGTPKLKVGDRDAILMSLTLREIFADEHEEIKALRKEVKKLNKNRQIILQAKAVKINCQQPF